MALYFKLYFRYDELAESVEDYVLDVLRDQLNRRQPMDNVSRNLLRLLTATCGYKEARLMAVQRLEMWLQNPKVRDKFLERTHLCQYFNGQQCVVKYCILSVNFKVYGCTILDQNPIQVLDWIGPMVTVAVLE